MSYKNNLFISNEQYGIPDDISNEAYKFLIAANKLIPNGGFEIIYSEE